MNFSKTAAPGYEIGLAAHNLGKRIGNDMVNFAGSVRLVDYDFQQTVSVWVAQYRPESTECLTDKVTSTAPLLETHLVVESLAGNESHRLVVTALPPIWSVPEASYSSLYTVRASFES